MTSRGHFWSGNTPHDRPKNPRLAIFYIHRTAKKATADILVVTNVWKTMLCEARLLTNSKKNAIMTLNI